MHRVRERCEVGKASGGYLNDRAIAWFNAISPLSLAQLESHRSRAEASPDLLAAVRSRDIYPSVIYAGHPSIQEHLLTGHCGEGFPQMNEAPLNPYTCEVEVQGRGPSFEVATMRQHNFWRRSAWNSKWLKLRNTCKTPKKLCSSKQILLSKVIETTCAGIIKRRDLTFLRGPIDFLVTGNATLIPDSGGI